MLNLQFNFKFPEDLTAPFVEDIDAVNAANEAIDSLLEQCDAIKRAHPELNNLSYYGLAEVLENNPENTDCAVLIELAEKIKQFEKERDKPKQTYETNRSFLRSRFANKICEDITQVLIIETADNPYLTSAVRQSPAYFGINTAFAVSEYVKNTLDAGGSQLNFYIAIDNQASMVSMNNSEEGTITCAIIDNGPGFPAAFLNQTNADDNKLLNYCDLKLDSPEGDKKSRIISPKIDEKKSSKKSSISGGQGLGIATTARILKMTQGKLEVGNVGDLTQEQSATLRIDPQLENGAVILLTSTLYSDDLIFALTKVRASYGKEEVGLQYINYVKYLNPEVMNLIYPSLSTNSSPSSSTLTSPTSVRLTLPTDKFGTVAEEHEMQLEKTPPSGRPSLSVASLGFENEEDKEISIMATTPVTVSKKTPRDTPTTSSTVSFFSGMSLEDESPSDTKKAKTTDNGTLSKSPKNKG